MRRSLEGNIETTFFNQLASKTRFIINFSAKEQKVVYFQMKLIFAERTKIRNGLILVNSVNDENHFAIVSLMAMI